MEQKIIDITSICEKRKYHLILYFTYLESSLNHRHDESQAGGVDEVNELEEEKWV